MCGIVGFVTPDPFKGYNARSQFLQQGLLVDSLRGMGGTGMGLVTEDKGILSSKTYKRALTGADFLNSDVCSLGINNLDDTVIAIGHNRAATVGSIKDQNCHPFHFKDKREIMLVHNGTLHDYYRLSPANFRHDVDSAHAAAALASSDDVRKTLQNIRGWFVLVWWDGTDKTFNIARNNNRDICMITAEDGSLFFGSEYLMVDWLLLRNNIPMPKGARFIYPEENQWIRWEFTPGSGLGKPKLISISPPKVEKPANQNPLPAHSDRWANSKWAVNRDKHLKELNLTHNELLDFWPTEWVGYNPEQNGHADYKYGYLLGVATKASGGKETYDVKINGITEARRNALETNFKEYALPVRVQDVQIVNEGKEEKITVIATIEVSDIALLHKQMEKDKEAANGKQSARNSLDLGGTTASAVVDSETGEFLYPGPGAIMLTKSGFSNATKGGCGVCADVVGLEDAHVIEWIPNSNPTAFLCSSCAADPELRKAHGLPETPISAAIKSALVANRKTH